MEMHGLKQPQAASAADKETSLLGKFAVWDCIVWDYI